MLALVAMLALVQGQPGGWSVWPAHPSVGDTVWLERLVAAPAGWRVRAGRLPAGENYEPLADPIVIRHEPGWLVRYAVVLWTPGDVRVVPPPVWRLGPGGEADSTDVGPVSVAVRSVIPDTLTAPQPQPAMTPLWPDVRRPWAPLAACAVALVTLAGGLAWRRRGPPRRPLAGGDPVPAAAPAPVADERWLAAGEPRAVAARAMAELRAALGRVVPAAHQALSTLEAIAAAKELPPGDSKELAAVLTGLDQVAFAAVHGTDVRALCERARALARELGT